MDEYLYCLYTISVIARKIIYSAVYKQYEYEKADAGMVRKRGIELIESDRNVLCWIGQQRGVRMDLLKLILGRESERKGEGAVTKQAAYYALKRWKHFGYVEYEMLRGHSWVWLTTKGMDYAGLPYRGRPPSNQQIPHTYGIALVRFYLETVTQARSDYWIPERDIVKEFPDNKYTPDGFWVQNGNFIPIQIELSWKGYDKVEAPIRWYCDNFKWVWYYTSNLVDQKLTQRIADNPQVSTKRLEVVRQWIDSYQSQNAV